MRQLLIFAVIWSTLILAASAGPERVPIREWTPPEHPMRSGGDGGNEAL